MGPPSLNSTPTGTRDRLAVLGAIISVVTPLSFYLATSFSLMVVQIRRPLLEEVLTATDEVYVTRILRRANLSDVSEVPDVFVVRP